MNRILAFTAVVLFGASGAVAQFVPGITGLYNTGESTLSGDDPNYALIAYPSGSGVLSDTIVTQPHSAWIANSTTSRWIGPFADARNTAPSAPVGTYVYELEFDIDESQVGDLDNIVIAGLWATDNYGLEILVNNNASQNFIFTSNSYASLSTFTLAGSGLFVDGTNSLRFLVTNLGPAVVTGNPSGLRVEFTSAIPEPTTYAAAMGALVLLIVGFRRFRESRKAA